MRCLVLGVFLAFASCTMGQARNWHWVLAGNNHINFGGADPILSNDTPFPFTTVGANAASIADTAGGLLFYAQGESGVHNVLGQVMIGSPPVDSLPVSARAEGSLVMPYPAHPNQYWVFMTGQVGNAPPSRLAEFCVDMALGGGLGEVQPGTFAYLADSTSGHLTGLRHGNGTDYWVISHKQHGDSFLAFRLTTTGVDTVPVVSHAGPVFMDTLGNGNPSYANYWGTLTANIEGDQLALAAGEGNFALSDPPALLDLYHIDNWTGTVTHWLQIPVPLGGYSNGVEFSPEGNRLYSFEVRKPLGSTDTVSVHLWQYDLSLGSEAAIAQSSISVFDTAVVAGNTALVSRCMAMGPDGKIYVSSENTFTKWFGVIEAPGNEASTCGYNRHGLQLYNSFGMAAPPFCKRYHDSEPEWLGSSSLGSELPRSRVVPNPMTSEGVFLWGTKNCVARVRWWDAQARLAREQSAGHMEQGILHLHCGGLPSGSYVIEVICSDGLRSRAMAIIH